MQRAAFSRAAWILIQPESVATWSEKIVPAGDNLISNPATVAEIKRILEENIVGKESQTGRGAARRLKLQPEPSL